MPSSSSGGGHAPSSGRQAPSDDSHHARRPSTSHPYAARVYSAANAAALAAQPFLGYLAGTTAAVPSTGETSPSAAAGSYPGQVTRQTSSAASAQVESAGQSRAPTPAAPMTIRRAGSTDEEARKKDSRNLDSIVSQFFAKSAQVITQARFTHLQATESELPDASTSLTQPSGTKKAKNRWFNLEMEESDVFRDELRVWRSVTSLLQPGGSGASSLSGSASSRAFSGMQEFVPSMVIEVILDVSEMSGNQVLVLNDHTKEGDRRFRVDLSGKGKGSKVRLVGAASLEGSPKKCNIVLERWTLSLKPPPPPAPPELPGVYKHCIIFFRALYTLVRALPVYDLHRKQKRRTGRSALKIGCRLSAIDAALASPTSLSSQVESDDTDSDKAEISLAEPLGDEDVSFSVQDFAFAPIATPVGMLDLRCKYRTSVDFSVEEIEALLSSRFIDEDFFKPTMRKYPSSLTTGSVPLQSRASPVLAPGTSRTAYGSLSSRHQHVQSTSQEVEEQQDEGAFIPYGRAKGAEVLSRLPSSQGAPEIQRRPSIGTSHPFKPSSSPSAQGTPSRAAGSQSRDAPLFERYSSYRTSSSPASTTGPSSSLRFTHQRAQSTDTTSPDIPISTSQLSYRKQAVPSSSEASEPPISGITAMHLSSPPASTLPVRSDSTGTQPMAVPGTSAIPLSSSPTPSLIKRYSSSRYPRSYGQGSSGSSPGDPQAFWGPESIGRRSRLSSGARSREDVSGPAFSAAPPTRQRILAGSVGHSQSPTEDADDIKSFLGMIDSRAQLSHEGTSSSRLLGKQSGQSTLSGRAQVEEKLRNLANSVYRDAGHTPPSSSSAAKPIAIARSSRATGNLSPSLPSNRSRTPLEEYSASPGEGSGHLSTSGGSASVRVRASQPPISGSIPEENSQSIGQAHTQHMSRTSSTSLGAASGSHYPFPRYVSSSVRRRGSSQSSGSATRPSILGPGQQVNSQVLTPSPVATPRGESPVASPTLPAYETAEDQTMGQLDFSAEGLQSDEGKTAPGYRWGA